MKATSQRPSQRLKYTACPSRVNINQQRNVGEWKITTARLHHDGHLLGEDVYGTYKHVKKLSEEDETYAKELIENAKILPRNLAECLSNRMGNNYNPKDAQNLIDKLKRQADDGGILEEHLRNLLTDGGDCKWSKDSETGLVNVLWVQSKSMKTSVSCQSNSEVCDQ